MLQISGKKMVRKLSSSQKGNVLILVVGALKQAYFFLVPVEKF